MLEFFHVENAFTAKSSVVLAFLVSWTPNWLTAVSEFPKEIMKIPKILGKETVEILNWVNRFSENACNKINMGSWGEEGEKSASEMSVKGKKREGVKIFKNESLSALLQCFVLEIAANSHWKEGFVGFSGAMVKATCSRSHLMLQDCSGSGGLAWMMPGVLSSC